MSTLAFLLQTAVVTRALFLVPLEGRRKFLELTRAVREDPRARARFFRRFVAVWWAVAAAVLLSLWLDRAPPASIGLRPIHGLLPWALLAGWLAFMLFPLWRMRAPGPYRDAVAEQIGKVSVLHPSTREERWLFAAVSLTAGICEELVFRGLVPAYFAKLLPQALWLAPLVSILGFGVAHWYQGARGVLISTLLGAAFYGAAALSGSVFAAMALHAANDLRFLALVLALDRPLVNKPRDLS